MKKITEKHRENLRKSHLGKKFSDETKRKMSLAHTGKPSGMIGKNHSEKTKIKMKESMVGKNTWTKGKKRSICGAKHHWWKGGITDENTKIRESLEYHLWREAVFARDNWTCQECGDDRGGNLNAHHIKSFSKHKELRTSIENGVTLCVECHKKRHKPTNQNNNK